MGHVQNLKALFRFFLDSCDEKIDVFLKKESVKDKVDRGVICLVCKQGIEDKLHKLLPCCHAVHTNCLKQKLIKDPLNYPCTICKENPNHDEEGDPLDYLHNLFDDKFMKEFGDKRSEAIINTHLKACSLCKAKFILEESEPNYEEKNASGEQIGEEAAECKAKFRIKCVQCKKENCIN